MSAPILNPNGGWLEFCHTCGEGCWSHNAAAVTRYMRDHTQRHKDGMR